MNYPESEEKLGDPEFMLDGDTTIKYGEDNLTKLEKRKAWNFAIGLNQIDGEYKPSETLAKLIEKEINSEIEGEEILKILTEKYKGKE